VFEYQQVFSIPELNQANRNCKIQLSMGKENSNNNILAFLGSIGSDTTNLSFCELTAAISSLSLVSHGDY
jgi:hypothetical protein